MTKRILALVMALCLVLAFAACNRGDNNNLTTTDGISESDGVGTDDPASEPVSDDNGTSEPVSVEPETDADGNTVAPTENTQPVGAKPSTKAEIVEYFNKAVNDVKPNAKSITRKSAIHRVAGTIEGVPGMVDTVLGGTESFINKQMANNAAGSATFTSAADKNANFPVENENWSSKLTVNDVQSAVCNEAGGVYTITLKTVADPASSNVSHGSGHAPKAFSVVPPSVVSDNIPGAVAKIFSIGTVTIAYPSSTVVVKVDAATGHVRSADYTVFWTLVIPLGSNNVVLPFATDSSYTVAY